MIACHLCWVLLTGLCWPPACTLDGAAWMDDDPIVVRVQRADDEKKCEAKVVTRIELKEGEGEDHQCIIVTHPPGDAADDKAVSVITPGGVMTADGESDHIVRLKRLYEGADDGSGNVMMLRRLYEDDDNPFSRKAAGLVWARKAGEGESGGPWLGIQFGPVSKPLASHLGLDEGVGQMVQNVVEGSPADEAGLEQYDVIVKIDGEATPSDAGAFLGVVKGLEVGETYGITLIHEGDRSHASLTVGEHPDSVEALKYKYEAEHEELSQGRVFRRGGMLEKDDEGKWLFKGFDHKDMPDVWKVFPDVEDFDFEFDVDLHGGFPDAQRHTVIYKSDNAQSIRIEKGDDGEIKVTRTEVDEDGDKKTVTKDYVDEEALEESDPDAHEMMQKSSGHRFGVFSGKGGANVFVTPGAGKGHGVFQLKPEQFKIDIDVEDILKETQGARKKAEEVRKKLEKQFNLGDYGPGKGGFFFRSKPLTSFEIEEDGTIRVITRQGEEELVQTFKSAKALKAKRPALYKKLKKLQGGEKQSMR